MTLTKPAFLKLPDQFVFGHLLVGWTLSVNKFEDASVVERGQQGHAATFCIQCTQHPATTLLNHNTNPWSIDWPRYSAGVS